MNLKEQIKRNLTIEIDTSDVMKDGSLKMNWCYLHNLSSSNAKRYVVQYKLWLSEKQETIDKIAELIEKDGACET
jgi:hypothetical protein